MLVVASRALQRRPGVHTTRSLPHPPYRHAPNTGPSPGRARPSPTSPATTRRKVRTPRGACACGAQCPLALAPLLGAGTQAGVLDGCGPADSRHAHACTPCIRAPGANRPRSAPLSPRPPERPTLRLPVLRRGEGEGRRAAARGGAQQPPHGARVCCVAVRAAACASGASPSQTTGASAEGRE